MSLGSASPNKGDITVDMHQNPKPPPPTPPPLLTSRVGPGEDVGSGLFLAALELQLDHPDHDPDHWPKERDHER